MIAIATNGGLKGYRWLAFIGIALAVRNIGTRNFVDPMARQALNRRNVSIVKRHWPSQLNTKRLLERRSLVFLLRRRRERWCRKFMKLLVADQYLLFRLRNF